MLALLGGYGAFVTATVQAHTQPSVSVEAVGPRATHVSGERQAAIWGVTIVWDNQLTCGQASPGMIAVGCYKGGNEIFINPEAINVERVIWHELGHYLSKRDGLGWGEAEADAYAERMTD